MGVICYAKSVGIGSRKVAEGPICFECGRAVCPECGREVSYPLARQKMYRHLLTEHSKDGWDERDAQQWIVENVPVTRKLPLQANNHFASTTVSSETQQKIASMGLLRVAGNVYECPSSQDFWQVTGGGKIVRLSGGDEVDNGEKIPAAPSDRPGEYLTSILNDLEF